MVHEDQGTAQTYEQLRSSIGDFTGADMKSGDGIMVLEIQQRLLRFIEMCTDLSYTICLWTTCRYQFNRHHHLRRTQGGLLLPTLVLKLLTFFRALAILGAYRELYMPNARSV